MFKLIRLILWTALFLVTVIVVDQTLVHIRFNVAGLRDGQTFYLDFRSRLLGMVEGKAPESIESAIEASSKGIGAKVKKTIENMKDKNREQSAVGEQDSVESRAEESEKSKGSVSEGGESQAGKVKYIYADEHNNLQFADSLDEIPLKFRKDAQPLKE